MNWDRIEGSWKQFRGKAREQWGRLTDDQFEVMAGRREQRAGMHQKQYAIAIDEYQRQLVEFKRRNRNWDSV